MMLVLVQARDHSTRLPGKIRADLLTPPGISMLSHVAARAAMLGEVVIAMPTPAEREEDVLTRFANIARQRPDADAFCRITADCPLLDVGIGAHVINLYRAGDQDLVVTVPEMDGLDVEVFSRTALMMADLNAKGRYGREHVTHWMRRNLSPLLVDMVDQPLRWSVDDTDGLEFVRAVYAACAHCAEGVPHHTNASGSIGGRDRKLVIDLHHMPAGDLAECAAADLKRARTGGLVYVSK